MTQSLAYGASCPECGTAFYVRAEGIPIHIDPRKLISASSRKCVCGKGRFEFVWMPIQEFYSFEEMLGDQEEADGSAS